MVFTPSTLTLLIFLVTVFCSSLPKLGHSNPNNYKTIIREHIVWSLHYSSSFMDFKQTWKEVTKGQRTCKFLLGVPDYKAYFHTHNHYWGGSQFLFKSIILLSWLLKAFDSPFNTWNHVGRFHFAWGYKISLCQNLHSNVFI